MELKRAPDYLVDVTLRLGYEDYSKKAQSGAVERSNLWKYYSKVSIRNSKRRKKIILIYEDIEK